MPTVEASHELVASREDVWAFLAEPRHLADWWPGVAAVEPDRRGLAPGARWHVRGTGRATLFRRAQAEQLLLVREVDRPRRLAWHLTASRYDVELTLEPTAVERTRATLTVTGPWLVGLNRSLPRAALSRLYDLCQTAASLGDAAV